VGGLTLFLVVELGKLIIRSGRPLQSVVTTVEIGT
jgi:hypothetical protein